MAAFLRPKSREMPDLQRFGPLGRQTPPPSPPPPASPPSSVLQQHQSDDKSSPTAPENWMSSNQRDDFTADNSSPPPPPPPPLAEPDEPQNYTSPKNDGKHVCFNSTVDFVLAYNRSQQNVKSGKEDRQLLDDETERQFFYRELKAHGILVNIDDEPTYSLDAGRTCFALLQLSRRYLCRCRCHTISDEDEQTVIANTKYINYQQCPNDSGNRHSKHDETLTSAQRVQMVWNIIIRIKYGGDKRDENVMDLNRLLEAGIFTAAYPVHDGNFKLNKGDDPDNTILNDRQVLYEYWARPGLIIPRQWKSDERITKLIRQYYGLPVAVYFRWLRYYTVWLIGPAIAGLVWFLYGFISTRQDSPTQDICDPKSPVANWILCPTSRCDAGHCIFTRVLDTCGLYRWTSAATFDRPGAVVFAIFMSFWATAFQQLWTTYSWQFEEYRRADETGGGVRLADCPSNATKAPTPAAAGPPPLPSAEQDRRDASAEKPRQPTVRPTTSVRSPAYITWGDIHRWYSEKLSVSFRAIVFLATLVGVATVPILIVVYRGRVIGWLMTVVFHQSGPNQPSVQRPHRRHNFFLLNYAYTGDLNNWKAAVAAAFAAFVQLTAIVAVHRGYSGVAKWLTQYSYRSVYDPRFQSRYTAFMSCFDSANYYSSLIYIAFFKGRFVTNGRGLRTDGASKIWNFWPITLFRTVWLHIRDDVCQPAAAGTGCVPELCIQLAIIMVGKQIVDNVIELMTPLASNVWRRWRAKENRRRDKLHGKLPDTNVETLRHPKQWQLDYQLEDTGPLGLYQEYSEMVIQYGFVMMFATVFPLAPLCALLNNVLEQRLDAYKMVAVQRRPVPAYYCVNKYAPVRGQTHSCCDNCMKMGTWTRVLKILSVTSVLYNAFMIAFTSDLLPRYIYSQISTEKSSSLDGYVAWALSSKKNISEYDQPKDVVEQDGEVCRLRGYDIADSEDYSGHWQVLTARLTFVIAFEHCVIAALIVLVYFIRKLFRAKKRGTSEKVKKTGVNDKDAATKNGRPPRVTEDTLSTSVVMVDMENEDGRETLWIPARPEKIEKIP